MTRTFSHCISVLLWRHSTGTDLAVTYQKAPRLSPSYLVGPPFSSLRHEANAACCAQAAQAFLI